MKNRVGPPRLAIPRFELPRRTVEKKCLVRLIHLPCLTPSCYPRSGMSTHEPTQPRRLHLCRSPNPAERDRLASESSAKRSLWRERLAATAGNPWWGVQANPRSAGTPVASKDMSRFPIRAQAGNADHRFCGPQFVYGRGEKPQTSETEVCAPYVSSCMILNRPRRDSRELSMRLPSGRR
jgi:hypothetical protein